MTVIVDQHGLIPFVLTSIWYTLLIYLGMRIERHRHKKQATKTDAAIRNEPQL
jgi:hypothetical protein